MSHTVKHSMPDMKSPAIMVKAFNALGWQVKRDNKCRTWAYNPDRNKIYPLVAINPSKTGYDIGIVQDSKGNLVLEGDTSMMGADVWAALGENFSKLKQQYSVQSVLEWADAHSGTATQEMDANGVIAMELEVEVFE